MSGLTGGRNCRTCKWGPHEYECRRTRCDYEEFTHEELVKKQEFAFLESIEFITDYFWGYIDEVMARIEEDFGEEYRMEQKLEDDYIFNEIREKDFFNWVRKQYPHVKFGEEIRRYFL